VVSRKENHGFSFLLTTDSWLLSTLSEKDL
jgi:hypothetical protein